MRKITKKERHALIREMARDEYHCGGEIEIDDNAKISENDDPEENGCYVQAWVWVRFWDTELDKQPDTDE